MSSDINLTAIAQGAKNSSYKLAPLKEEVKNNALLLVAEEIRRNKGLILEANKKDLDQAKTLVGSGKLSESLYSRLKLDDEKIEVVIEGIKDVAKLEDPVNKVQWAMELDKNLELYRVSCPIGVIGVIFESRPDVIPQIAALAIKSANAVILKGGSEASFSNEVFVNVINGALAKVVGFPENSINLIKTRHDVEEMLKLDDYIDLIIPRGGNKLVKYIQSNTKIPVLGHAEGICHVYIDEFADQQKATRICVDSKVQYPSACNAVETILVHKNLVNGYLSSLIKDLREAGVVVKGDDTVRSLDSSVEEAFEDDWKTEYGDKVVSIKVVNDIPEAINHVNGYGSGHTDSIVTENMNNVELFMDLVDSAGVYHNVSTRFADGFRYGLGAEVGISTNKTHARGPVGLEGLIVYKYKLFGNGQIVADYSGKNARNYTHRRIK